MNTKEIRKRKGFYFCLLAFTSVLLLLLLSVVSLFWPTRRFSASERRNLAQRPKLSYEGIVDGTFSNEVESYLADQYPARDIWVYLNSLQNRILGIDYQNGIYRGKDGYLIQGFEKSWYESWISTSKISELPNVTVVDCTDELAEAAKTNQIYYRTDHHWTTYGASAAFKELAKQMDLTYEEGDFEAYTVHAKFQGTMMSSSGFYSGTKDTIDLYLPKEPETILVTNKEAQTTTTTIYSEEGLLGNDPYEVFVGGPYGLWNIQTSSQSGRKLLLLKDSYANAMIGFLTPYFSEIDIIDPRYYSSDLDMQIAVNQYTDLLILYNLQSFAKDSSLALVLGEEAAE